MADSVTVNFGEESFEGWTGQPNMPMAPTVFKMESRTAGHAPAKKSIGDSSPSSRRKDEKSSSVAGGSAAFAMLTKHMPKPDLQLNETQPQVWAELEKWWEGVKKDNGHDDPTAEHHKDGKHHSLLNTILTTCYTEMNRSEYERFYIRLCWAFNNDEKDDNDLQIHELLSALEVDWVNDRFCATAFAFLRIE